jgi:hypothetical protein
MIDCRRTFSPQDFLHSAGLSAPEDDPDGNGHGQGDHDNNCGASGGNGHEFNRSVELLSFIASTSSTTLSSAVRLFPDGVIHSYRKLSAIKPFPSKQPSHTHSNTNEYSSAPEQSQSQSQSQSQTRTHSFKSVQASSSVPECISSSSSFSSVSSGRQPGQLQKLGLQIEATKSHMEQQLRSVTRRLAAIQKKMHVNHSSSSSSSSSSLSSSTSLQDRVNIKSHDDIIPASTVLHDQLRRTLALTQQFNETVDTLYTKHPDTLFASVDKADTGASSIAHSKQSSPHTLSMITSEILPAVTKYDSFFTSMRALKAAFKTVHTKYIQSHVRNVKSACSSSMPSALLVRGIDVLSHTHIHSHADAHAHANTRTDASTNSNGRPNAVLIGK